MGRNGKAQGQRTGAEDVVRRREDQRQGEAVPHQTTAGIRTANAALEEWNLPKSRPRDGEVLQRALGHGTEWVMGNVDVQVKPWEETCVALRMTPQRSPF